MQHKALTVFFIWIRAPPPALCTLRMVLNLENENVGIVIFSRLCVKRENGEPSQVRATTGPLQEKGLPTL